MSSRQNDTTTITLRDLRAFTARIDRLSDEQRDAVRVMFHNPTDAAVVAFEAFDEGDALDELRAILDTARACNVEHADTLDAAFVAWGNREDYCDACKQHKPCSCDDMDSDRELVRLRRAQRARTVRASVAAARSTSTPARVHVDASPYIASHGVIPKGRGSWAFALVDPRGVDVDDSDLIWEQGLYSNARRAAQQRAAARNVSTLWVCS